MKTILILSSIFTFTASATEFKCIANGKLHSAALAKSGPAYSAEVEGMIYNAEETGDFVMLAIFDDTGTGARAVFPISAITPITPANLTLTFMNGSPNLKCGVK